ncbi:AAA family ATPase [Patulibacter sp. SYSU D01012]|uniref:AAA family ATPase n=1 Tax=Patulibacter sp. SYSU D01012 TaxID=2817381 RepID=UPI001B3175FD|nr:AAA family ATPase [Patulibacter sp. SYSU D01012]
MGLHSRAERAEIMREIRARQVVGGTAFVRALVLPDEVPDAALGHAAAVPAVAAFRGDGLALHPRITFLVGENGSGKSTLAEAIAVACGLNAEGGGRNMRHATRPSHAPLGEQLRVVRGPRRPATDFFLRAESVFTLATDVDRLVAENPGVADSILASYGGQSLHEVSHGESFLAIVRHRFGRDGFYVLDEPEAALSPRNVVALLRRLHALADDGCQLVVATHSPVLLACPGARILLCDGDGVREVGYEEAPAVALTRDFLADPAAAAAAALAADD